MFFCCSEMEVGPYSICVGALRHFYILGIYLWSLHSIFIFLGIYIPNISMFEMFHLTRSGRWTASRRSSNISNISWTLWPQGHQLIRLLGPFKGANRGIDCFIVVAIFRFLICVCNTFPESCVRLCITFCTEWILNQTY